MRHASRLQIKGAQHLQTSGADLAHDPGNRLLTRLL
jgi:hypothetical protein